MSKTKYEGEFRVRDRREPGWNWFQNELITVWGPRLGANAIAVYVALCKESRDGKIERLSTSKIAEMVGLGRTTVTETLELMEGKLILREAVVGQPSVYYLIDLKAAAPLSQTCSESEQVESGNLFKSRTGGVQNLNNTCSESEQPIRKQDLQDFQGGKAPQAQEQKPRLEEIGVSAPEGLEPLQYAAGILERLGIPSTKTLLVVVGQALQYLARDETLPLHKACDALLARAQLARENGEYRWLFWFQDGRWKAPKPVVVPKVETLAERTRRSLGGD
jgi:hypothetical protein